MMTIRNFSKILWELQKHQAVVILAILPQKTFLLEILGDFTNLVTGTV